MPTNHSKGLLGLAAFLERRKGLLREAADLLFGGLQACCCFALELLFRVFFLCFVGRLPQLSILLGQTSCAGDYTCMRSTQAFCSQTATCRQLEPADGSGFELSCACFVGRLPQLSILLGWQTSCAGDYLHAAVRLFAAVKQQPGATQSWLMVVEEVNAQQKQQAFTSQKGLTVLCSA